VNQVKNGDEQTVFGWPLDNNKVNRFEVFLQARSCLAVVSELQELNMKISRKLQLSRSEVQRLAFLPSI